MLQPTTPPPTIRTSTARRIVALDVAFVSGRVKDRVLHFARRGLELGANVCRARVPELPPLVRGSDGLADRHLDAVHRPGLPRLRADPLARLSGLRRLRRRDPV